MKIWKAIYEELYVFIVSSTISKVKFLCPWASVPKIAKLFHQKDSSWHDFRTSNRHQMFVIRSSRSQILRERENNFLNDLFNFSDLSYLFAFFFLHKINWIQLWTETSLDWNLKLTLPHKKVCPYFFSKASETRSLKTKYNLDILFFFF